MTFNFADGEMTSAIIRSVSTAERYGVSMQQESTKDSVGLRPRSDGVVLMLTFIASRNASCFSQRYNLPVMSLQSNLQ